MSRVEINKIASDLIEVSSAYFDYDAKKKKIVEDYRGNTLSWELANLQDKTKAKININVMDMNTAVDRMMEEVKTGNKYNASDSAISTAASLLSKPGADLAAVAEVVDAFKGNQTALQLLKASAHESYKAFFDKYIFDNVKALEDIKAKINMLSVETVENFPAYISEIRAALTEFIDKQGVDAVLESEMLDKMRMRNIASMMGIKPEEFE